MASAQTKTSNELTADGKELESTDLAAPLLTFDLGDESKRLRLEEHWLRDGRISKTLVKYSDFRIVLILMQAGTLMQEHKADARISIHALSGRLQVQLPEKTVELSAGHLLVLEKCQPHDVKALEESALLLSISWPHGDDPASDVR
jgi:quercetin dioxygenase-like cupin family protein